MSHIGKRSKEAIGFDILMKQTSCKRKVSRDIIFAKLIDTGMKSENIPLKKPHAKLRN
jgi:hypothetical protein